MHNTTIQKCIIKLQEIYFYVKTAYTVLVV
jgi:hypothetical protein